MVMKYFLWEWEGYRIGPTKSLYTLSSGLLDFPLSIFRRDFHVDLAVAFFTKSVVIQRRGYMQALDNVTVFAIVVGLK